MTLPSSGALSLANIQTEFGGSNPISLSEYYAGGSYVPAGTSGTYGAVPSSGQISIRNFYGTTKGIDVQSITVGSQNTCDKVGCFIDYTGFSSGTFGSISDGTFNPIAGAAVKAFYHYYSGSNLVFKLVGIRANSGWTSVTIGGQTFNRASAAFTTNSTNNDTTWTWSGVSTNPMPTSSIGSVLQAVFL